MHRGTETNEKENSPSLVTRAAYWTFLSTAIIATVGFPIAAMLAQGVALGLSAAGLMSLKAVGIMAGELFVAGKIVHFVVGPAVAAVSGYLARKHPRFERAKEIIGNINRPIINFGRRLIGLAPIPDPKTIESKLAFSADAGITPALPAPALRRTLQPSSTAMEIARRRISLQRKRDARIRASMRTRSTDYSGSHRPAADGAGHAAPDAHALA
jgi:hypothetical protein